MKRKRARQRQIPVEKLDPRRPQQVDANLQLASIKTHSNFASKDSTHSLIQSRAYCNMVNRQAGTSRSEALATTTPTARDKCDFVAVWNSVSVCEGDWQRDSSLCYLRSEDYFREQTPVCMCVRVSLFTTRRQRTLRVRLMATRSRNKLRRLVCFSLHLRRGVTGEPCLS